MKLPDTLKIVTRNLRRRKGRTILTAIGVTIGTAAIVAMMSLAIGLKENVVRSINSFGSLTEVEVYPGWNRENPNLNVKLDQNALNRIKLIPGVKTVMPRLRYNGTATLKMGQRSGNIEVMGIDTAKALEFNYKLFDGRYLGNGRNEAVISYNVPEVLTEQKKRSRRVESKVASQQIDRKLKEEPALRYMYLNNTGTITIKKANGTSQVEEREFKIKVVGILTKAQNPWSGGIVHLPMELVKEMNEWSSNRNSQSVEVYNGRDENYESLIVRVLDQQQVAKVVDDIRNLGYSASSPLAELEEVNQVFLVIQIVLAGIGAISLLVATIGIINTMVMSILERTREIGIMKVLGATIPNIRNLFLLEAGGIGFFGGVLGLGISYGLAAVVNVIYRSSNFLDIPEESLGNIAVIPLWLSLFALAFATVVGVLAGLYPAMRAAKLSPLNAIRQE